MATPKSHTEQKDAKGPFPPFAQETYPSQLVSLAVVFGLLYLLMSRVALPRVASILAARKGRIEGDLSAAQKARTESEAAQAAYEKSLADARSKAQGVAAETQQKAAAEAEAQRKTLEAQLHSKLEAAEKQIAATKSAAMSNVRSIAVDTAGLIVERLTGKAPAKQSVERAVDAALH
jgi:F-type H+-transporting ATPase subunit b